MNIQLTDTGKRFNRDWIFRHFTFNFQSSNSYAITGPNGSGKSTLLQCIAGSTNLSEGEISYFSLVISSVAGNLQSPQSDFSSASQPRNNEQIQEENIHRQIAIVAPYLELIEEMTANEFLKFHFSFKKIIPGISFSQILTEIGLEKAAGKQIRYFSSGMKQRLKLAQAVFANVPVILLDEPCTNLDKNGYDLYHRLIQKYCTQKLIIVSSNDVNEYDFCKERISILDYKLQSV